jgi:predicted transglutaminase-like cysteine proteinase
VLEVEGWILDNRSKWVVKRDYIDYTWISISGFSKGDDWRSIFGGTE